MSLVWTPNVRAGFRNRQRVPSDPARRRAKIHCGALEATYSLSEFRFKLWNWKSPRRFVVVREQLQTTKPAVGRKLIDLPGYVFRVFVTNHNDAALEIWRDYNGRAAAECRIDELKNELAADHSAWFFATESAFLAVVFSFNLLSEFQRAVDPALKPYKQPATLRFEVYTCDAILGRITWCCTCLKTGVATRSESRYSTTSYIGLRQLLRNLIRQQKMPHDFQFNFGI